MHCHLTGFELRYSGTGREYVVENLEPGHTYGVRVAGVAADQQSEVCVYVTHFTSTMFVHSFNVTWAINERVLSLQSSATLISGNFLERGVD